MNRKVTRVSIFVLMASVIFVLSSWSVFAANSSHSGVEQMSTASWPNDGRFLGDQIDVEFRLSSGSKFLVATRPSQMVIVSFPAEDEGPGMIRKYGFILHPDDPSGKPAGSYLDIQDIPSARLSFTMLVYCLEETPAGELDSPLDAADASLKGGCRPRSRESQLYDDARRIGQQINGIGLNERVILASPTLPVSLQEIEFLRIARYGRGLAGGPGSRSLAQSCLEVANVEICSCRVTVGEATVNAGCQRWDSRGADF